MKIGPFEVSHMSQATSFPRSSPTWGGRVGEDPGNEVDL